MKIDTACCNNPDGYAAGCGIAREIMERGRITAPTTVFAFCSAAVDAGAFVRGLRSILGERIPIVGGSTIGVITNTHLCCEGFSASALIIEERTPRFRIAAVGGLDRDEAAAGRELVRRLEPGGDEKLLFVFWDSIRQPPGENAPPVLNASAPLLDGIFEGLAPGIPLFGAGLLADYGFGPTVQFCGHTIERQSAVGVLFKADVQPCFRITHGCTPLDGVYHTITRMQGDVIYEIDGEPAATVIDGLYGSRDWRDRTPVSLVSIGVNLGEKYGAVAEENCVIRLITGVLPDGAGISLFEPDLETGSEILFMLRDSRKMLESARQNAEDLMKQIRNDGHRPLFGMYIDCAGRASRQANTLTEEAAEIQMIFNRHDCPLFGFYSGVEVAPFRGRSRGLDWTGVLICFAGD
jgi:hypothetical protein